MPLAGTDERVLHVLTGCTAVGKTELALRWAEQNGAEILSCDSLLFYRGMDIGTAKPTPAELARVPHHLINNCDLVEAMDIARYVELARQAAADIHRRGRRVLVTGGSGFYLKAFFAAVTDGIEVSPELRRRVAGLGAEEALAELLALNPGGLGKLDTANPRRVSRALERCLATGRPLSEIVADFARQPSPFADWQTKLVQLDRDPVELSRRIAQRVDAMLAAGLLDEVRVLLDRGLASNPSAASSIGYRESIACIEGRLPAEALRAEIIRNTCALVKKQRTWFRTQLPAHACVHPDSVPSDMFLS